MGISCDPAALRIDQKPCSRVEDDLIRFVIFQRIVFGYLTFTRTLTV